MTIHNHPDTTLYDPARCPLCGEFRGRVMGREKPQAEFLEREVERDFPHAPCQGELFAVLPVKRSRKVA